MFKKRIFSLFMTAIMLFSAGAAPVLAAGADSEYGIFSWGKAAAAVYIWPTPNATTISQYYSSAHTALDIAGKGSNVYASRGGTIVTLYKGCTNESGLATGKSCASRGKCKPKANGKTSPYWNGYCNEGFGNGYFIQHADGTYAGYGHLDSLNTNLKVGSKVNQGTKLGTMGSSGRSTGHHLHFELRGKSNYGFWSGAPTNPLNYVSPNTANDKEAPTIIAVTITNVTAAGYTVSATVADPSGVEWVKFPTWTSHGGQDDLAKNWKNNTSVNGKRSGNIYTFDVKASDHNNESGEYVTAIYAKDNKGNVHTASTAYQIKTNIYSLPKISQVRVADRSSSGYTVICTVTSSDPRGIDRVQFPTWTEERGQAKDLATDWSSSSKYKGQQNGNVFTYRVNTSSYGKVQGTYTTHIYAYDKTGQWMGFPVPDVTVRDYVRMTSLSVSPTSATLTPGETLALQTSILPANAEDKLVIWESSNTSVAKVSWKKGVVTAVSSGTATITGTANDGSGKIVKSQIKVYQAPTSVKLNTDAQTLTKGESALLSSVVQPSTASNKKVTWKSNKPNVVSVSAGGKIKALKNGKATITCTTADGGKMAKCKVYVGKKVTGIQLNTSWKKIKKGSIYRLSATVKPAKAANKTVLWTSSKKSVATVDEGKVLALKAGKTVITAKTQDRNKKATCTIKVGEAVKAVSIAQYRTIKVGGSTTLRPTFTPTNVAIKAVSWKSNKTKVATVSAKGKVRGHKKGRATITCISKDGKKKAKCVVFVGKAVTSVKLNKTQLTLNKGASAALIATLRPKSAVGKKTEWRSSNTKVATVNKKGVVKARSQGKATIICEAVNGKIKAKCTVTVK